ncbi:hypothetical protein CI102_9060 [Trichoderma harzianum]|nr:hypothetical protein CI102_9060 [Trichoderma harzianum]
MTSSSQDSGGPQKWALLIGINYYIPGNTRHPVYVTPLTGCVNDVEVAENYLFKHQHMERQRIQKLTASFPSTNDSSLPAEPPENWPTYENIKQIFERVTKEANTDDIIYIHYSGHGGRVVTIGPNTVNNEPNLVNRLRIDEALVSVDFNTGGRYFRDIELACVLKKMTEKGLHVTLSLTPATREVWEQALSKSRLSQRFGQSKATVPTASQGFDQSKASVLTA